VSRSLAACEGAILLVDATQGVQAQTIATFYLALEQGLTIVPVANKVDMDNADVSGTAAQMGRVFGTEADELIPVSAKTGLNMEGLLDAVVERVGPPRGDSSDGAKLRMLLLDCNYDPYRGAVSVVQVVDGKVAVGDKVMSFATGQSSEVLELGMMTPEALKVKELRAGHVGYVITGLRDVKSARVGDTLIHAKDKDAVTTALPGFRLAKPMVFQGLFPTSADQFENLRAAVDRLTLNDASVSTAPETSAALGPGFRCGFLGLLHADVFHQRLQEEFGTEIIATAPTVPYRVTYPGAETWVEISSPSDLDQSRLGSGPVKGGGGGKGAGGVDVDGGSAGGQHRTAIEEPMVEATIICSADATVGSLAQDYLPML
jgi:GTP-binding protein LepA